MSIRHRGRLACCSVLCRHGRACPDHPRLRLSRPVFKTWMPGTRPSMTAPKPAWYAARSPGGASRCRRARSRAARR
ncbi:MAG: hypothetical protein C0447_05045 [Methylobacterium sp.]|nr:hypothetical protein [Methylobacterium sp.]